MDWKIVSVILIVLLVGVGLGYTVSFVVSQRDYSGQLSSIESQLESVTTQLSELNQSLGVLGQISNNTMYANEHEYSVISQSQNATWPSPGSSTGALDFQFNCSGFSNMLVYLTVDGLTPSTGATWSFWLSQIDWAAYSQPYYPEYTSSLQNVAPGVLTLTTNPQLNFNGSTKTSLGGASFVTLGNSALLFVLFNSTEAGTAQLSCTIYLRN